MKLDKNINSNFLLGALGHKIDMVAPTRIPTPTLISLQTELN